jgi:serine protease AprX
MVELNILLPRFKKPGIALLFIVLLNSANGQSSDYNFFYRVYFRDKGLYNTADFKLSDLFTDKAVARREKAGLPDVDFRDLPVNNEYTDQVLALGFKLHCTSRWMNTALFKTEGMADINAILNLPFVAGVRIVKNTGTKSNHSDKLAFSTWQDDSPAYDRPLSMINGISVHNSGFNGKGVMIAVLDGGFLNADNITSLLPLRNRNGIRGTRDFVNKSDFVYDYHNHGTAVLSVLAGSIPGSVEGSAPGADYWLLRTEDTFSEFPAEEDYWVAGAEFADSAGADIITSSLGYFTFDDPSMDYKYSDFDGNTAFVTVAADIAASKGILVVNSAGNERTSDWIHIIAPSDGDSVVAVGAVDGNNMISSFSSAGPSSDGRVKPDVVTQGVSIPVQISTAVVSRSSGTSFSCPVLSGMCACIMQAVPEAGNYDIISALHSCSDRSLNPDSLYGYGIPDIVKVINQLQDKLLISPDNGSVIMPNPFTDDLTITFREPPEQLRIEIFNTAGKFISTSEFKEFVGRSVILTGLGHLEKGLYLIRLKTSGRTIVHKAVKISN